MQPKRQRRSPKTTISMVGAFLLLGSFSTPPILTQGQTAPLTDLCPEPIAKRMTPHVVKAGETIDSIAQKYQLVAETLISVNSQLSSGSITPGQTILIPPFNGRFVTVPAGATWRDLAAAYGLRADILFEINGCTEKPGRAFIPGISWGNRPSPAVDNYTGLAQWPIQSPAQIGLDYGWQNQGAGEDAFFHSGVDLLAPLDTPVMAAAAGEVILVSQEGAYGFLVVIDHGNGRQTRYAHLSRFAVGPGEKVPAGKVIGYVGSTGRPDIAPSHLHFEVRVQSPVGWAAQDPKLHLPRQ
ncbi:MULTISPECIES: LysM peptidoglycan-binding domain-containing M23 family metallopeptidase [Synechocystis]|uniref:LysM peptidoglycan-binding domain-containing M23 family metallopeptidase n=1 Tax=Synechocystis TaxID=1142 RepID=UPI0030B8E127